MYLDRVVLTNIKGFNECDIELHPDGSEYPGWIVITGDNGSGKTALLRAVALALVGPEQTRALLPDLRGWVAEGADSGVISVGINYQADLDTFKTGRHPQGPIWAEVAVTRDAETGSIAAADVYRKKRAGASNGPWGHATGGWFALGYGPFRRLYGTSSEAQRLAMIPGRIPRFLTLFREDATLSEGEEWAKDLTFRELEAGHEGHLQLPLGTLDQLMSLIRDNYLHRGVTIERVTADGILMKDAGGRTLPLADMSDGYRAALAMLIDIFRHMVSVYGPDIVVSNDSGHSFVDRPGVVLIDEIDAHLHPAWQREIGFWLRGHFPKVQFLVTTHSPLVCAAADGGRIYHLPAGRNDVPFRLSKDDFNRVVAGRPDQILLTPAFDLKHTRSPRAVDARKRHAVLVSKQLELGELPPDEAAELKQLALFTDDD